MKRPDLTIGRLLGAGILLIGLYATFVRITRGLGASTNLSDTVPWGIWIGFDVLVGVGLAAGGFTITATVHLFHLKRFESIIRPTILTAFLGYVLVIIGLLFDLGQPHRIWHPLIMWNPSSVMFEVGWCVTLYTTVLALEFSPIVFEKFGFTRPLKWVRSVTIPLVIGGVILSTLHQSSLGTLYVIIPDKLHALWYSPLLPVHFFLSAIAAGLGMVILESYASSGAFGTRLEFPILLDLGRVTLVVLGLCGLIRFQDLLGNSAFNQLDATQPEGFLFLAEIVFGMVVPFLLLAVPAIRESLHGLRTAALLVVLGFVLNRLNVSTVGVQRAFGTSYFPSLLELAVTASLVVAGIAAFKAAVKHLNIFPPEHLGAEVEPETPAWVTRIAGTSLAALALMLGIGAWSLDLRVVEAVETQPEQPTEAHQGTFRLPDDLTMPQGGESPGPVVFSHEDHAEGPVCRTCHTGAFSILSGVSSDAAFPPARLGDEPIAHSVERCGKCHNDTDAFGFDDACESCHAVE